MEIPILLVVVIALTLLFDFINGFHDAANAIATVVSTRALTPLQAVIYAGILNLAGALIGTKVAATIGKDLVDVGAITMQTVLCTIIGAIVWNLITWWKGLPTSSSHALIGSLLGAAFFSGGTSHNNIHWVTVWSKIVLPMVASPFAGIVLGFAVMTILTWLIYRLSPQRIQKTFGKLQILSAGFMALNHGTNDAQKSMGIIALALMLSFPSSVFVVPIWVKLICAIVMGLGTCAGGWKIIRTLGSKITVLTPAQGFAAETTAGLIIGAASHFGIPVSTTQVISTSIMGVGAVKRFSAVRWGIVGRIVWAWVLTLPLTFAFSGALMWGYNIIAQ